MNRARCVLYYSAIRPNRYKIVLRYLRRVDKESFGKLLIYGGEGSSIGRRVLPARTAS